MVDVSSEQSQINRTFDYNHTYTRDYDTVKQEFSQLQVGPINSACTEWSLLAKNLGTISEQIRTDVGMVLDEAWQSKASADAQKHLQVAQATAEALANHSMTMARATDYAHQYASWYQGHVPGEGLLPGGATQAAVDHLVKLMNRYDEVLGLLPAEVQSQFVKADAKDGARPDQPTGPGGPGMPKPPGGGGAHTGTGVGNSGLGNDGLGNTGLDNTGLGNSGLGNSGLGGAGTGHGGTSGLSPYDPGSALAGGGGLGSGGLGGGLGSGGVGSGGVGSGLGPGGVGAGGVGGGPSGVGTGGAGAYGPGGAGRGGGLGSGAGGAGAGGRAGGMGGAPHGGHGGEEEERERSTWLTEDEDVWGGNTDLPPPVIGG
jgi:hypothetical protein